MSCNYADGLSPYHDKGQLGLDEKFDSKSVVAAKVALLATWINGAKHVVIHTGAGISTSAGIPDFRGPRGVWTLQAKGLKPDASADFNEAIPTPTHMAITKLVERNRVKYVVSQNIDGLHVRSNLQRHFLSELHGNMFIEQCNICNRQFVRNGAVPTVGQKNLGKPCPTAKPNGRPCRGRLHDTILDWEHSLPENDLAMADFHSCMADLSICLGTTMQIVPSGNLPLYTKKHGGKLVICNLQPTKHKIDQMENESRRKNLLFRGVPEKDGEDSKELVKEDRKADLLIHAYVDDVMTLLMKTLNLKIPKYAAKNDPTKSLVTGPGRFQEWTISDEAVNMLRKTYEQRCGTKEAKKRLEMIDDDDLPLIVKAKRAKAKEQEEEELEVLDVIVKKKSKEKDGARKHKRSAPSPPPYNSTIVVKKVQAPAKKRKEDKQEKPEKITIKKNVTPTKTKYEIVQPTTHEKPEKLKKLTSTKCEIVYCTEDNVLNDLEMICESDDDQPNNFTTNFKRYLYDDCQMFKEEDKKKIEEVEEIKISENETKKEELKEEIKDEKVDLEPQNEVQTGNKPNETGECSETIKSQVTGNTEIEKQPAEVVDLMEVDMTTEKDTVKNTISDNKESVPIDDKEDASNEKQDKSNSEDAGSSVFNTENAFKNKVSNPENEKMTIETDDNVVGNKELPVAEESLIVQDNTDSTTAFNDDEIGKNDNPNSDQETVKPEAELNVVKITESKAEEADVETSSHDVVKEPTTSEGLFDALNSQQTPFAIEEFAPTNETVENVPVSTPGIFSQEEFLDKEFPTPSTATTDYVDNLEHFV